jgi:hypothetical protein
VLILFQGSIYWKYPPPQRKRKKEERKRENEERKRKKGSTVLGVLISWN